MSAKIYIEGGGDDSKELHVRCREGFRRLLERCGFKGRMPPLVACGGRGATYSDFATALAGANPGDYVAMLVNSEYPVANIEKTWEHLKQRDNWDRPAGADDEHVLLMTTCMETWIATDRRALRAHFGAGLQESAIPVTNMESRSRHAIQDTLARATRNCKAPYVKNKKAFELVGKLDPSALRPALPSFVRSERVLERKL